MEKQKVFKVEEIIPAWSCGYDCTWLQFNQQAQCWQCARTKVPIELAMRKYAHGRQCRPVAICKIEGE